MKLKFPQRITNYEYNLWTLHQGTEFRIMTFHTETDNLTSCGDGGPLGLIILVIYETDNFDKLLPRQVQIHIAKLYRSE